jgi:hypothetical protein
LDERRGLAQVGLRFLYQPPEDVGEGEVLEDGDDVGEAFVERGDVHVRRLL